MIVASLLEQFPEAYPVSVKSQTLRQDFISPPYWNLYCSASRETAHHSGQTLPPPLHKPLHLIKARLDFLGRINGRRIQTRMAKVLLHDVKRHL